MGLAISQTCCPGRCPGLLYIRPIRGSDHGEGMVDELLCGNSLRLGELLDEDLILVLHPLDDDFQVIAPFGFVEQRLRQFVALRIKGIPLAVGIETVTALDAVVHQRTLLRVFGGDPGGIFDFIFGVVAKAHYVHDITSKFHFLMRPDN